MLFAFNMVGLKRVNASCELGRERIQAEAFVFHG